MIVEQIDLYAYFNLKRPANARGYLTVYALDNNEEIGFNRQRSAILVIPGGGYGYVSYREGESVAIAYLQHGINAFVLNYSIAPHCHYPTQLREAAMSMIFIRENAKKYHVDPETVAAIGFSAGGHLCGCLGTMFNSSVLEDLRNCDFVRPTAVILSYPVTIYGTEETSHLGSFKNVTNNNTEINAEYLSLEKRVTKFASPAFIWHTVNDDVVPVIGSITMAQKYNEYKIPFELHLFEKGQHGLSVATKEVNSVNENVAEWLRLSVNWLKTRGFIIYS